MKHAGIDLTQYSDDYGYYDTRNVLENYLY